MHKNVPAIFTLLLLIGIPLIIAAEKPVDSGLLDLAAIKTKENILDETPADVIAQQIYGMNFLPVVKLALSEPQNSVFALSGDVSRDIEKEAFVQLRTLYLVSKITPDSIAEQASVPLNSPIGLIFAEVPEDPNRQSNPAMVSKTRITFDYKAELLKRRFRIPPKSIAKSGDSWILFGEDGKRFTSRLYGSRDPGSLVLVGAFTIAQKANVDLIFPDEYFTEKISDATPLPQSLDKIAQAVGIELKAVSSYRRGLGKKELAEEGTLATEDHLNKTQHNFIEAINKIRESKPSSVANIDPFQGIRPDSFWPVSLFLELTNEYPADSIAFHIDSHDGITNWYASASGKVVFSIIAPDESTYGKMLSIPKGDIPSVARYLSSDGIMSITESYRDDYGIKRVPELIKSSGEKISLAGKEEKVIQSFLLKSHFEAIRKRFTPPESNDFNPPGELSDSNSVLLPSAQLDSSCLSIHRYSDPYIVTTACLGEPYELVTYAFEKNFFSRRAAAQAEAWQKLKRLNGEAQERVNEQIRQINRAYRIHELRQEGYLP